MPAECYPTFWAPKSLSITTAIFSATFAGPAVIGNSLIVLAVICDPLKQLRSPFNYFLINLVASDMIVGCITLPISVWAHINESRGWYPEDVMTIQHLSFFISSTASILHLLMLSIDRYFLITNAVLYRTHMSWKNCAKVSVVVWTVALCTPLLYPALGYIKYLMLHFHAFVLTCAATLLVNYVFVYKFLRRRTASMLSNRRDSEEPSSRGGSVRRGSERSDTSTVCRLYTKNLLIERKVTQTLLLILIMFVSSMLPATVMIYVLQFCETCPCNWRHVLRDIVFLSFPLCSAVNPIICLMRLRTIKTSLRRIFDRVWCVRRYRVASATVMALAQITENMP